MRIFLVDKIQPRPLHWQKQLYLHHKRLRSDNDAAPSPAYIIIWKPFPRLAALGSWKCKWSARTICSHRALDWWRANVLIQAAVNNQMQFAKNKLRKGAPATEKTEFSSCRPISILLRRDGAKCRKGESFSRSNESESNERNFSRRPAASRMLQRRSLSLTQSLSSEGSDESHGFSFHFVVVIGREREIPFYISAVRGD